MLTISLSFPSGDFAAQSLGVVDPASEALSPQDADLDLNHVEPACVLGGVVELDPPQDPPGFGGRERLIQGAGRVGRQVILHNPNGLGIGIMDVDEVTRCVWHSLLPLAAQ